MKLYKERVSRTTFPRLEFRVKGKRIWLRVQNRFTAKETPYWWQGPWTPELYGAELKSNGREVRIVRSKSKAETL